MQQAVVAAHVAFDDYFEAETTAQDDAPRHEWLDGVVYAMSRGTPEHARLVSRLTVALGTALPEGCQLYASDLMLSIPAAGLATYADLSVVCGALETLTARKNGRSLGQAVTNPVLVVEVLSESTERYDRDGKFQAYKQIASLEEYVLVSQDERKVEVFRRKDGWSGEVAASGAVIVVHGVDVDVDRLYATAA
jgi:Uma2 family endonuclease